MLARNFSVAVGGFAIMDNHLHVLCRLDPDQAKNWTAEETVRRWIAVYPPGEKKDRQISIHCRLDSNDYPKGRNNSDLEMSQINIKRNALHCDWNYGIKTR